MSKKPWIGVDLDGTLAHYDGWRSQHHIGDPIAPMVDYVERLLRQGLRVKVFTARAHTYPETVDFIQQWTELVFGQRLEVTATKDMGMIMLIDDRARRCLKNLGLDAEVEAYVRGFNDAVYGRMQQTLRQWE